MAMKYIDFFIDSVAYTNVHIEELKINQNPLTLYRQFKFIQGDTLSLLLENHENPDIYIQPDYKSINLFKYPFSILFSEIL
jgi:hypothetical protein